MNLALFDFDGTITTRDAYPGFCSYCSPRWRVWLGWTLLGLPYLGMKRGWVSPKFMRLVLAFITFSGTREAHVRAAGERYARDVIPGMLRPEAMARIDWHRAQGDCIVVVSGSMAYYLEPWARANGLEVVCNRPTVRGVRLTGLLEPPDCDGENKVRRVRARYDLAQYPLVYAYGDSAGDRPMLAIAHRRWFRWEEQPA
jgi:phosphatidylglycerophosphatase C